VIVPLLYASLAVNVVVFLAFGIDKWKARRRAWRIPEGTLLWLTWATGLVGGWMAISFFRHKTKKRSFRIRMYLASVFNLAWPLLYLGWRGDLS
jgi:uncharacterized membrane protein YsdA (DUF1294 family)